MQCFVTPWCNNAI